MDKHEKQNDLKKAYSSLIPNSDSVKAAAGFIALLTVLGSFFSLAVSSFVSESYSDYYGIQKSNLDILTTAKDMIVLFWPLLISVPIARYSFLLILYRKDNFDTYRKRFEDGVAVVLLPLAIVAFLCELLSLFGLFGSKHIEASVFSIGIIILGFILFFMLLNKENNRFFYLGMLLVMMLVSAYFVFSIMFAVNKFNKEYNPHTITSYEIINVDNKDYAVVYTAGNRKLAMSCNISYENEIMILHYGKYRLIQTENYEYDYHAFHTVIRDVDLQKEN